MQLASTINRIALEKRRNIRITLFEYCSHLLLIGILLGGYGLSIVVFFPPKVYDSYQVRLPPFADVGTGLGSFDRMLDGPLPTPTLDSFVLASKFISSQFDESSQFYKTVEASSYGQTYGNLLKFGDLHLAPASEEVESFVQYLNEVHIIDSFSFKVTNDVTGCRLWCLFRC
jgi:hypothetical protein